MAVTEFHVYDTTMRDGAQQEGLALSVADKLIIAGLLDDLGVGFIEGGWPGAIPKDTEFFARARTELSLKNSVLAAFGATRKPETKADADPQVRALLDSEAPVVTLVAKSHIRHVEVALRTTGHENLAMIAETVAFLRGEGRRVMVDAEHFFDGFRVDREYAMDALRAAFDAGAEVGILCDTNGGMLPSWVRDIVEGVAVELGPDAGMLGIHAHNDTGCAVANSIAAVQGGARHVQGTVNGYGERTGNADIVTVVADLELKLGMKVLPEGKLAEVTRVAQSISEITNIATQARQPYVGASAFAHKAGLHASAIRLDPDLYQHIDPAVVGNDMRMLISDMAGRASIELKAREFGIDLSDEPEVLGRVMTRVKEAEARGFTFDAADASFELLVREELEGCRLNYFEVDSWRVVTELRQGETGESQATIVVREGDEVLESDGVGNGPVNALDHALRRVLAEKYPELAHFELVDYKVRILESTHGTDATTRVLITTAGDTATWQTVGVGPNVLDASWDALVEGIIFGLRRSGVTPR